MRRFAVVVNILGVLAPAAFAFAAPAGAEPGAPDSGTGRFKSTPAEDGPGGLVWASDHTGVAADLTWHQRACFPVKGLPA